MAMLILYFLFGGSQTFQVMCTLPRLRHQQATFAAVSVLENDARGVLQLVVAAALLGEEVVVFRAAVGQ